MLPTHSTQSSSYSNHTNVGNGCMSIDKRFGLMNFEHRELVGTIAGGWERPAGFQCHPWDSFPWPQYSLTIFVLSVNGSWKHTSRELLSNLPHESRVEMFATRPTRKGSNAQNYHTESENTFHWRKCWSVERRGNLPCAIAVQELTSRTSRLYFPASSLFIDQMIPKRGPWPHFKIKYIL